MANPTTNFGWVMPTSTDLVTDLPADFAVFGQGVDTSLADLNGGTTGQILSKASNTNLDFTWVSANPGDITGVTAGIGISGGGTSGDVTVTNSMATAIDAKGDLIVGTGADTFSRLAVGTNNYVLTADSAEATGLKWAATAASGTRGLQQIIPSSVAVGSGTATVGANGMITLSGVGTNLSINGCFTGTYTNYKVIWDLKTASSHTSLDIRMRASGTDDTTASGYKTAGGTMSNPSGASGFAGEANTADKFQKLGFVGSVGTNGGEMTFYRPNLAEETALTGLFQGNAAGDYYFYFIGANHTPDTAYDGFSILTTQSLSGRVLIYGWSE